MHTISLERVRRLASRTTPLNRTFVANSKISTFGKPNSGLTLMEMVIGVAILSAIAIFVVIQYAGSRESINVNQAVSEIEKLRGAAVAYRSTYAQSGVYDGLSSGTGENDGVDVLSDGGFGVAPFDTGAGENTFGLDVEVTSVSGGERARINYMIPTFAICAQLATRYSNAEVTGDTSISTPDEFSDGVDELRCDASGNNWEFVLFID